MKPPYTKADVRNDSAQRLWMVGYPSQSGTWSGFSIRESPLNHFDSGFRTRPRIEAGSVCS